MINPDMFALGYCAEFALALCELYGYQLVSFDERCFDGFSCSAHYAAKRGDVFIDVRGCRKAEDIIESLWSCDAHDYIDADTVTIRELTARELESETEIVDDARQLAFEYIVSNSKMFGEKGGYNAKEA